MTYVPPTPEELVVRIHEQREKCRTLHVERSKAWYTARDAQAQHDFLVGACGEADREEDELVHALKGACARQAYEMVDAVKA